MAGFENANATNAELNNVHDIARQEKEKCFQGKFLDEQYPMTILIIHTTYSIRLNWSR